MDIDDATDPRITHVTRRLQALSPRQLRIAELAIDLIYALIKPDPDEDLAQWLTRDQIVAQFARAGHGVVTKRTLDTWIAARDTNGLDEAGVLSNRGRQILIHAGRFVRWMATRKRSYTTGEAA